MEYSYKFVLIVDLGVSLVNLELMVDDMTTKELREKPVLAQPLSLSLSLSLSLLYYSSFSSYHPIDSATTRSKSEKKAHKKRE